MTPDIKCQLIEHAKERPHEEVCGLIVQTGKKWRVIRARNLADNPKRYFDLDPSAYLEVMDSEEVIGFYHSHPLGDPTPSEADLVACEEAGVAMHIVTAEGGYSLTMPTGMKLPYKGRTYVYGAVDCYSLLRDWYMGEFGIHVPDYPRNGKWWVRGEDLYMQRYAEAGFVELVNQPVKHGDVFLIQVQSKVANHVAIWLDGGKILHHQEGRLSCESPWSGHWERHAVAHLRHKSRLDYG